MKTSMRQGAVVVLLLASLFGYVPTGSWAQQSPEATRKALVKTPAIYPTMARSMHIRGVVKLEVQVAPNGSVKSVEVKGGHPMLAQAAVTAMGHWKFEPAAQQTTELIEIKFEPE